MKRWITFAIVLAAVLGAAEVVVRIRRAGQETDLGTPAPDFALADLGGREVSLSSLRGRVVAVNFWATWCPPCKQEIPEFAGVYASTAGKCLELLGVAADSGTAEEVASAAKELGVNYPVLLDDKGEAGEKYKVQGYPMTFLVDVEGRVRKVFDGAVSRPELEEALAPLLAEAPASCPRRL